MTTTSVSAPAPITTPQSGASQTPEKKPEMDTTGAADGTRLPQPTVLAALPPGQGMRIDQLV